MMVCWMEKIKVERSVGLLDKLQAAWKDGKLVEMWADWTVVKLVGKTVISWAFVTVDSLEQPKAGLMAAKLVS
jgi:hypothetical protein